MSERTELEICCALVQRLDVVLLQFAGVGRRLHGIHDLHLVPVLYMFNF